MNNRLLQIRKSLNLTQKEFCCNIGIKPSTYCELETGKANITERTIINICSVYNVNRNWLETGQGEMYNIKDLKYEEFFKIFNQLTEPLQDFLIQTAKELLKTQFKL